MKKYFLLLMAVLVLISCDGNEDQKEPANLLSKEKMTEIMIDLHIEESKLMQKNIPMDSGRTAFKNSKALILKNKGVSQKDFHESYKFYIENIKELDVIYSGVIDSLSLLESQGSFKN